MDDMSTTWDSFNNTDGRDIIAHHKSSQPRQQPDYVHDNSGTQQTDRLRTVNSSALRESVYDHSFHAEDSLLGLDFGELVGSGTDTSGGLSFLDNEDFHLSDGNQNPRLEFSPDFHGRVEMGSENRLDLGHSDIDNFEVRTATTSKKAATAPLKYEEFIPSSLAENIHINDEVSQNKKYSTNTGSGVNITTEKTNRKPSKTNGTNLNQTGNQYMQIGRNASNNMSHVRHVTHYCDSSDSEREMSGEGDQWHCHADEMPPEDKVARNQLIAVCTLCSLFMIGEGVGAVLSSSLALFTDVLHLGSDLVSFFISLLAIYLSRKPPSRTMTLGYHRAEVLGALFSVFIIWFVTGVLCYMAIERIINKHYLEVHPDKMLITASIGVVFNIVMGIVLHTEKCCGKASSRNSFGHGHSHSHDSSHHHSHHQRSGITYEPLNADSSEHELLSPASDGFDCERPTGRHKNINVRAAFIHVIGDIIQSIGVLIAALIMKLTDDDDYKLADPICTFLFSILVLITTITVLRDTLRIIMEGFPRDFTFQNVLDDLQGIPGVKMVHSLNVWSLTIDRNAMSVHIVVDHGRDHQSMLQKASHLLKSKYKVLYTTIQVEDYRAIIMESCDSCQLPYR